MIRFEKSIELPLSLKELWSWHTSDGAFTRLVPPWQKLSLDRFDGIENDALGIIVLHLGPLKLRWHARHLDVEAPNKFTELQEKGPFNYWKHQHCMFAEVGGHSRLLDKVEFKLPLSSISHRIGKKIALREVEKLFRYRHQVMANDINRHSKWRRKRMKILISGASGMLGQQLDAYFSTAGHEVFRLVRRGVRNSNEISWDPSQSKLEFDPDFAPDVVINLSGANVGKIPWSDAYKKTILDSRLDTTQLLVSKILEMKARPNLFISASATGYYGDGGDEEFDIDAEQGEGFLASVCGQWESASEGLIGTDVRRVLLRLGPVITARGGMLEKLLLPTKLGLGATIGDGKEWLPWVGLDDVLGAIEFVVNNKEIEGPINVVSPEPVRMVEFQDTLASVLGRPRFLRAPAGLLKMLGGEAIEAMALTSTYVKPNTLVNHGFEFIYPQLKDQIRYELGKTKSASRI